MKIEKINKCVCGRLVRGSGEGMAMDSAQLEEEVVRILVSNRMRGCNKKLNRWGHISATELKQWTCG